MKPDKPNVLRRPFLRSKWFFDCNCHRCLDPTELGSHLSSLICDNSKCGGTVVICSSEQLEGDWSCLDCGGKKSYEDVVETFEQLENLLVSCWESLELQEHQDVDKNNNNKESDEDVQERIEILEKSLNSILQIAHHCNYWSIQVQNKIIEELIKIPKLNRTQLQRKIQLCSNVKDCLAKVDPGFSRWFCQLSMELSKARLEAGRRDLNMGYITQKQMEKLMIDYRFNVMYLAYQQAKVTLK